MLGERAECTASWPAYVTLSLADVAGVTFGSISNMRKIRSTENVYRLTFYGKYRIMVCTISQETHSENPLMTDKPRKHFLVASDFDQTLSFNDSGLVLSELLGISGFEERVAGLAKTNLVQQGGELAYLIRHDPEFRGVRPEHLVETGRRVRLKHDIPALVDFLKEGSKEYQFSLFVISAAPREIVVSALAGVIPAENIFGTELDFDARSGEVRAIKRVPAGYGKVAVIEELQHRLKVTADRILYVGDGSSDIHVMLHVNNHDGFTIAVSENKQLARIAKSTVISESAFSIMVPILDQVLRWGTREIRELFESHDLSLNEWEKDRTDRVKISEILAFRPQMETAVA
jgi:HAD superfamily phosphoserine phosphatase-like hydrolase